MSGKGKEESDIHITVYISISTASRNRCAQFWARVEHCVRHGLAVRIGDGAGLEVEPTSAVLRSILSEMPRRSGADAVEAVGRLGKALGIPITAIVP